MIVLAEFLDRFLARTLIRIRKVQPRAIVGLGVSMLAFLALFQNCGQFTAIQGLSSNSVLGMNLEASTKVAGGLPYSSTEMVSIYSRETWARPVILSSLARLVYVSRYGDDFWQLSSSGIDGGGARRVLISKSNYPSYYIDGFNAMESGIAIVLLRSNNSELPSMLLGVPENGAATWLIASQVQNAQVSQDGARVNYVAGSDEDGWKVFTSTISNPSPVQLGTAISSPDSVSQSYGAQLTRSSSPLSNVPTFYLISHEAENPGAASVMTATLYSSTASRLPATISFPSYFGGTGEFDVVRTTTTGKYIVIAPGGSATMWFEADGTFHENQMIALSPNGEKFVASGNTTTSTPSVYYDLSMPAAFDTSTPTPFTSLAANYGLAWSADSRFVMIGRPVLNGKTDWTMLDTQTGTSTVGTRTGFFGRDTQFVAVADGGRYVVVRDGSSMGVKLSIVAADGSTQTSITDSWTYAKNYQSTVLDTGSKFIFQDGWGLYSVNYDGTQKTRLDVPRASEPALTTNDMLDPPAGSLFWDAKSARLVYEPVFSTVSAYSYGTASHRLASVNLTDPNSTVTLSTGTKNVKQISGFFWNYRIFEDLGIIAFNSPDGTNAGASSAVRPSIMSWVGMAGGTSTRVSPTFSVDERTGLGTGYYPPLVLKNADGSPRFIYDFFSYQKRDVRIQSGSSESVLSGYDLHKVSPDGQWLFLVSDSNAPYVLRTDAVAGTAPTPLPSLTSAALYVAFRGTCFGCGGSNTWTFTDDSGTFTADSKIIVTTGDSSGAATENLLFDLNSLATPPVPLGFATYLMLADGKTMVAQLADASIVKVSTSAPAVKTPLATNATMLTIAGNSVVYSTKGNSKTLFAVDLTTGAVTNLIPATLPAADQVYSVTSSKDGSAISYVLLAANAVDRYACTNYHYVTVTNAGTLQLDLGGDSCQAASAAALNSLGRNVTYIDADKRLHVASASGGWTSKVLTPVGEIVQSFTLNPNGQNVAVLSMNGSNERIFSVYSLESGVRMKVGGSMPIHKAIGDFQFTKDGRSLFFITDAAVDGVQELVRADLTGGN